MTQPSSTSCDVVVIGAGTAGLSAYRKLKDAGRHVLLVDHGPLGTMCARVGCMPSEAMLHAAHRWATADALARWSEHDSAAARDRLWRDVRAMRDELADGTARSTRKDAGDDLVMGTARFVGPNRLDVDGRLIDARAFVVATGSRPALPEPFASLGERALTTDSLFELKTLPASIGVVGVGNVGIELGLALARFGLRVVALDAKDWPGGIRDPEIAARAIERLSTEIDLHLGVKVDARAKGDGVELRFGDRRESVERVLVALGRTPNLDGLALDRVGVRWSKHDEPPIDEGTLRLADSCLFVAGDASPERPLQHEAVDEGKIAATNALALLAGAQPARVARRTPLSIVFTDPDLAQIGVAFDALDDADTLIVNASGDANGRSKLIDEERNLIRLYVSRASRKVVGASVFATRGENLAHLIALAIGRGLTVDEFLAMPSYHPTMEELLQNVLDDARKQLDGDD